MKIKAAITCALLVVISVVFAACGGTEDGEITTTTKAPTTSEVRTTVRNTTGQNATNGSVMDEMSSAADDVSEGLSDTVSEIGSGIRGMFD